MEILHKAGFIIISSILSGVFGRMGGAGAPFKSWMRDWVCPLIILVILWLLVGFKVYYWIAYLMVYVLTGLSLTTYYDPIFKKDNFWFAGGVCGLALFPSIFIGIPIWAILSRAGVLALIWGSLNKYLPSAGIAGDKRILLWRRDVVEEFIRYFSVPFTLLILLVR